MTYDFSWFNSDNSSTIEDMKNLSTKVNLITPQTKSQPLPMKYERKHSFLVSCCSIMNYRMAKIYCHINQCDASVKYFAILHAVKETLNTKNTLTLTFIRKNKRRSTMQQCLRKKTFVARQNHYVVRRKILAIQ